MSAEPLSGTLQSVPGWNPVAGHRHVVQFYETDGYLLNLLTSFVQESLKRNNACVLVMKRDRRDALVRRLTGTGMATQAAIESGQLLTVDADEIMKTFKCDGMPNPQLFADVFEQKLSTLRETWQDVRVFGEMVALTAERGEQAATLALEELWNELLQRVDFTLYCAYPLSTFDSPETVDLLKDVCDQHTSILPAESYALLSTAQAQLREVTMLQQKAQRLEREIVQRKQAEERLRVSLDSERQARERAETALTLRDQFVSVAAHELKTPLTALLGHAQLLRRWAISDSYQDPSRMAASLETVARQANKLAQLVSRLLDTSRIESGNLAIEPQPADISEIVRDVVQMLGSEDGFERIEVEALPVVIAEVDPLRLEQVIANLISNAQRYSPEGGPITVNLQLNDDSAVELSVRDHGIGIPEEKRSRIFEPYYQAHQNESRSGMGLGLYISQQIIELHGGTIEAEFPADGGTRFVVRLPVRSAQRPMVQL